MLNTCKKELVNNTFLHPTGPPNEEYLRRMLKKAVQQGRSGFSHFL